MRTVPAGTGRAGPAVKARVSCRPALSRKAATHRRADGCNLNLALYDIAPGFGPGWGLGQTKSRTQQDQARASSDRHRTVALTWAHGLLRWVGQGAMPRSLSFGRYPISARCPHRAPRQCPGSPRGTRAGPDCENGYANGRIESDFLLVQSDTWSGCFSAIPLARCPKAALRRRVDQDIFSKVIHRPACSRWTTGQVFDGDLKILACKKALPFAGRAFCPISGRAGRAGAGAARSI